LLPTCFGGYHRASMALTSLVVCADLESSETLARVLKGMDMSVEHSATPAEAASRLAEEHFGVVLVDCTDETAAMELIGTCHDHSANTLIVAIVDAGNAVREIFEKGASFVLYKPISAERASSSLRAAHGMMRGERRRKRRVPAATQASVSFAISEDTPAPLLNLSEEGAALHSEVKMPPPCKVYLQFALPGQVSNVRLSGDVMWQDSHGRVGLRFAHVPQASRRVLDDWLRANLSRYQSGFPRPAAPPSRLQRTAQPAKPDPPETSPGERRVQTRLACRLGVEVYRAGDKASQRCTLTDLSNGGCYVETTMPLPPGARVEIMVRTQELRLRLRGIVQSVDPGFGMGVQYTLKTAEDREQVERVLASQGAQSVSSAE
jgi:CheY-like chemotaxis protein